VLLLYINIDTYIYFFPVKEAETSRAWLIQVTLVTTTVTRFDLFWCTCMPFKMRPVFCHVTNCGLYGTTKMKTQVRAETKKEVRKG
jgi:hypothetical protein